MSYICERCGKQVEDSEKFGSGRFCSRACANARIHSAETKDKIRSGLAKTTQCFCQYCGKEFSTLISKANHENQCSKNPNRALSAQHQNKMKRFVTLYSRTAEGINTKTVLDITYEELEQYRQTHPVCEICGRPVEETIKWNSKFAAKNLCVDHNHVDNTFRGLLCQVCNRQLGWYENNKDKIKEYLGE